MSLSWVRRFFEELNWYPFENESGRMSVSKIKEKLKTMMKTTRCYLNAGSLRL